MNVPPPLLFLLILLHLILLLLLLLLFFLILHLPLLHHSPGVLDTVRSAACFLFFIRATRSPRVKNIRARSVGVTSSVRLLGKKRKRMRERNEDIVRKLSRSGNVRNVARMG